MRSFAEYFSFETYSILAAEEDSNRAYNLFQETLVPVFRVFFYDLLAAGRIAPMDTLGRDIDIINFWNRAIVRGERLEDTFRELAQKLVHSHADGADAI